MTLILALECADGLLLASDSQSTFGTTGQPVKAAAQKVHCQWSNVVWGAAGNVAIMQRVQEHFRLKMPSASHFESKHPNAIRLELVSAVSSVVRDIARNQYLTTGKLEEMLAAFLFVGRSSAGSLLLEVTINLADLDHRSTGYAAIGSGDIFPYFAMAGLAHFDVKNRSLPEAKAIAYRIMEDAINVAAYGLGPPIQIVELTKPTSGFGVARALSSDELRVLSDTVLAWKSLESELLTQSLGIGPQPIP